MIGIDEVGRGPGAGPVTVCAVLLCRNFDVSEFFENGTLKDSKKLSKKARQKVFDKIKEFELIGDIKYDIQNRDAKHIDSYGIRQSLDYCVTKALKNLKTDINDFIYLDGSLFAPKIYINQSTIIKGDEKILAIALASIVAKVTRDNYMIEIARDYQGYFFEKNMGYLTKDHIESLKKYGCTDMHRLSFLKNIIQVNNENI